MKYYRGTKRRKRSSKSKVASPESQNAEDVNEVSVETSNSQPSTLRKENAKGRKRPSSSSCSAEEQSTGRVKRAKTTNKSPEEETNSKHKTSNLILDSSDKNESKTSSRMKKGSRSITSSTRRTTRGSIADVVTSKRVSARKITRSNKVDKSDSDSSLSDDPKAREIPVTKLSNKRKSKQQNPGNQNLSEKPDSVFEDNDEETQPKVSGRHSESSSDTPFDNIRVDGSISSSEFLNEQVKILKSTFEIEDCPELAAHLQGTKRQQKNHIPKDIALKVLRKLNYRVEDELLKTLNRQAQRKILKQIDKIRSAHGMVGQKRTNKGNTELQEEPGKSVEELKKSVEASMIELDGLQKLTDMAATIESMAEGFSKNSLAEDVKHTNELIQEIDEKFKKEGFSKSIPHTVTTKGQPSHKDIVDKLFS